MKECHRKALAQVEQTLEGLTPPFHLFACDHGWADSAPYQYIETFHKPEEVTKHIEETYGKWYCPFEFSIGFCATTKEDSSLEFTELWDLWEFCSPEEEDEK